MKIVLFRDARRMALDRMYGNVDEIIAGNEGKVPSAATSRRGSFSNNQE